MGKRQYRYNEEDVLNALIKKNSVMREEPADYGQDKKLTYEDYAQIPPKTGYTLELVDDLLSREPSPTVQHQRIASRPCFILSVFRWKTMSPPCPPDHLPLTAIIAANSGTR